MSVDPMTDENEGDISMKQGDTLVYCRVSERTTVLDLDTDMQEHLQKALKLQLRQCEEFSAQLGYELAGHIEEIADGADIERDGLYELYAYGESGVIKRVLVADSSRLSFVEEMLVTILHKLAALDIEVVYATM